ncbi:hypothetical protein V8C43DRAFT_235220 [Trichoderma afarasin]
MATCFPSALSIFLLAGAQGCGLDLACRQGCVELLGYHLHPTRILKVSLVQTPHTALLLARFTLNPSIKKY